MLFFYVKMKQPTSPEALLAFLSVFGRSLGRLNTASRRWDGAGIGARATRVIGAHFHVLKDSEDGAPAGRVPPEFKGPHHHSEFPPHVSNRAMVRTEQLPAYAAVDSNPSLLGSRLPPSYADTTLTIGTRTVRRPLVSIGQLKSHLRLLGMFTLMKRKVENPDSDPQLAGVIPPLAKALSPNERWVWFLELAVERYVLAGIS